MQQQEKLVFVRELGNVEYEIIYVSEPLQIEDLYKIIQETLGKKVQIAKITLDEICIKNNNGIRYMFRKQEPKLDVVFEDTSLQIQTDSLVKSGEFSIAPVPVHIPRPTVQPGESKWLTPLEVNPYSFGHTGVSINDHLFVFGGFIDDLTSNTSYLSDPSPTSAFNKLRVRGDIPPARERHSATLMGKKVYVFGGYNRGPELYYNSLYYFDSETLTWYKVEPNGAPPERRCGHSASFIDGKLWIFGGRGKIKVDNSYFKNTKLHYMNDLYCYDPGVNEWLKYEPRGLGPSGRALHSATAVGRKIYVFGGANSSGNRRDTSGFCDLYELDIDSMTWTECETQNTPPSPCYGHSATYLGNDRILYFGGKGYNVHNSIHILDLKTMSWTEYAYGGNVLYPRWGHSATLLNNKVVIYGGRCNLGYHNTIQIIETATQLIPLKPEELEKERVKRKQEEKNREREAIMSLQNAMMELQATLTSLNNELVIQKHEVYQIFESTRGLKSEQIATKSSLDGVLFI